VELVEYSVNAVSEGIDSVAQTRVVIRSLNDAGNSQIHSQTGAEVHRSFRWGSSLLTLVLTEICDSLCSERLLEAWNPSHPEDCG
jgi:hypothetical protein